MPTRPRLQALVLVAAIAGVLLGGFMMFGGCDRPADSDDPTSLVTTTPAPVTPATSESTEPPTATHAPTDTPAPEPTPTWTPELPTPTATESPTATPDPPTVTPEMTATATAALTTTATVTVPVTTPITTPEAGALDPVFTPSPLTTVPWVSGDQSPLAGRVWVGLYGTPAGRGLGILGRTTATETVRLTIDQAMAYQALLTDTQVVPYFHMVVVIADAHPGADGNYNHRVSSETLQLWIDVGRQQGVRSALDIQPGHSPLETELAYLEPFVRQQGVHVAIDPEFMMLDGSIPGQRLGMMTGDLVNVAQAWLNEIAAEVGERKVLIIHQFDDRMFSGKEAIIDYPLVDLVWDADGFGGPGPKIADYQQYANEPGFEWGGFKLFYEYDTPVMTPEAVLGLMPMPAVVIYQ